VRKHQLVVDAIYIRHPNQDIICISKL